MTKMKRALSVLLCCIVLIAAAPLAVNTHLRETYVFTISHWLTKIRSPKAVFVGDSITAGAGWNFHGLSWFNVINLGAMGLTIHQIESLAKLAVTNYQPQFLFVMAGTNDVVSPHYHADEIKDDHQAFSGCACSAAGASDHHTHSTYREPHLSRTYRRDEWLSALCCRGEGNADNRLRAITGTKWSIVASLHNRRGTLF